MDLSIHELLLKRLKCTEFIGNYTPTMGMISKSNLNPQFFKLRKVFAKKSQISADVKCHKQYIKDLLRQKSRKRGQKLYPSKQTRPANHSYASKLPQPLDFSYLICDSSTYSIRKPVKPIKLSIFTSTPAPKYDLPKKWLNEQGLDFHIIQGSSKKLEAKKPFRLDDGTVKKNSVSQSLDLSPNRRQIIFSKQRDNHKSKDFSCSCNAIDLDT